MTLPYFFRLLELTIMILECIIYAEIYGGKPPVERKENWHDLQH